jgi:hypothetical protein
MSAQREKNNFKEFAAKRDIASQSRRAGLEKLEIVFFYFRPLTREKGVWFLPFSAPRPLIKSIRIFLNAHCQKEKACFLTSF